jgi:uncharacterized membrane protein YgcG
MRYLKYAALLGALLGFLLIVPGKAAAQVRVGIAVGPVYGYVGSEPACAYGYYPYYPYACAPYGYWGPSYFVGGVFIGAGPWYHGWGHGYYGHGYYGRPGYGYYGRGYGYRPGYAAHGNFGGGYHGHADGGFHGNAGGGFHGGGYHGGSGFHGGGGSHGGGGHR